jgi:hypothetical protein
VWPVAAQLEREDWTHLVVVVPRPGDELESDLTHRATTIGVATVPLNLPVVVISAEVEIAPPTP